MSEGLYTLPRRLNELERSLFQSGGTPESQPLPILRSGQPVPAVDTLDALMTEARNRQKRGDWMERATSDRWLAPRVHCCLRLFRSEAADRGVWQWIALRYHWYVNWRWADEDDLVAEDRWWGQVHKQAFARLWWGAELSAMVPTIGRLNMRLSFKICRTATYIDPWSDHAPWPSRSSIVLVLHPRQRRRK